MTGILLLSTAAGLVVYVVLPCVLLRMCYCLLKIIYKSMFVTYYLLFTEKMVHIFIIFAAQIMLFFKQSTAQ